MSVIMREASGSSPELGAVYSNRSSGGHSRPSSSAFFARNSSSVRMPASRSEASLEISSLWIQAASQDGHPTVVADQHDDIDEQTMMVPATSKENADD